MGGVASVVRDRFRFRVYYVSPLFKITPSLVYVMETSI
jgi:hypothetical protein